MILNLAFAVGKETAKLAIARLIARGAIVTASSMATKEIVERVKNEKKKHPAFIARCNVCNRYFAVFS